MNKKILLFIITLLLSFSLSSCNKKETDISITTTNIPTDSISDKEETTMKKELSDIVDFILDIDSDSEVKILQLTDIQIIDSRQSRYGNRLSQLEYEKWDTDTIDENAFKYMDFAVNASKPDLIVLTGDNVYGEFDDSGASLEKLIKKMDSYKIPWCAVFGNHDNETTKGIDWTIKQYEDAEYSLFKRGNVEGNSNYSVAILNKGKLNSVLFMMDSNGCTFSQDDDNVVYKTAGYYPKQLEWFERTNQELKEYNNGENVPNTIYSHISVKSFADALYEKHDYLSERHGYSLYSGGKPIGGQFKPIKLDPNSDEDFGYLMVDFGSLLDAEYKLVNLAKKYGTLGFFFGHEHKNNISVVYEGIRYTYGTKTGTYDSNLQYMLGGTLINISNGELVVKHLYYQ